MSYGDKKELASVAYPPPPTPDCTPLPAAYPPPPLPMAPPQPVAAPYEGSYNNQVPYPYVAAPASSICYPATCYCPPPGFNNQQQQQQTTVVVLLHNKILDQVIPFGTAVLACAALLLAIALAPLLGMLIRERLMHIDMLVAFIVCINLFVFLLTSLIT